MQPDPGAKIVVRQNGVASITISCTDGSCSKPITVEKKFYFPPSTTQPYLTMKAPLATGNASATVTWETNPNP